MNTSAIEMRTPKAVDVKITEDSLTVELSDGRSVSAPLAWFPRLLHANTKERKHWRLIGNGHGIHWEDLDEDISVESLLAGLPSGESQASFGKWLRGRTVRQACSEARWYSEVFKTDSAQKKTAERHTAR